jgi:peptidoglycan/LPS O-acetylase OafA/YrhL
MLRAFGAIGIGYFIGEWYKTNHQQIKDFTISAKQKLVVTVLEFCCLFYIINNLMLRLPKFHNDLFYIVCFTAIIILFLAKKGYISTWLDNDKWAGLSKYTYSIYMTHPVIITAMKCSVWKYHKAWVYNHPCINIIIALTLILALGVFTYEFVEKKANDYFKKRALQKVA